MKIAVLGATGDIGVRVVEEAVAASHDVVAFSRRPLPARIAQLPRVRTAAANVYDSVAMARALSGVGPLDAVVSCLGPRSIRKPEALYSKGLLAVAAACASAGVPRLVILTSDFDAHDRDPGAGVPWFYHAIIAPKVLNRLYDDMRRMEDVFSTTHHIFLGRPRAATSGAGPHAHASAPATSVGITIVRPYNFKAWPTKEYRAVVQAPEAATIPGSKFNTSRAALAAFLACESWKPSFSNKAVMLDTPSPVGCF